MPKQAITCFSKHKPRHLETLASLVRIPSISFDGFDTAPMGEAAAALTALCKALGFEVQALGNPPCLVAERRVAQGLPTVALYAHYDVQPPGEASAWQSPPFTPTVREGRLYGRGTADDKGGILVHLAAIEAHLSAHQSLPVNVKLIFDGEEEVGSPGLAGLLQTQPECLAADALVVMDTSNPDTGLPGLTTSLRGTFFMDVEVEVSKTSLHSGMWGGPVPDAAMALAKMLAGLVDDEGRPLLEAPTRPPSEAEETALKALPFEREDFARQAGLLLGVHVLGESNPWRQNWHLPALTVNAFEASSRAQARNILNSGAYARLSIRTVPGMGAQEAGDWLETRLRTAAPWGVRLRLRRHDGGSGWRMDAGSPPAQAALRALTHGYGCQALAVGCGASIPLANQWAKSVGARRESPVLLLGVVDPASFTHAENESLHLGDWEKAVHSEIHLLAELPKVLKPSP
jgi:acetylornithine deacetylase/succinyl-diaminopimelate desuccinylase-like protein